MKTKLKAVLTKETLITLKRCVPVFLLVLSFFVVNFALLAKNRDTSSAFAAIDTQRAEDIRKSAILGSICADEDQTCAVSTIDPFADLKGLQIRIKEFLFTEFPEDEAVERLETEFGFEIITERVFLPEDDYEDFAAELLAKDDYDVAILPYMDMISVVQEGRYFKEIDADLDLDMISFNGQNIGILADEYPAAGLFYNKRIIEEAGLEDPIELFKRGEWDLDAFFKYLQTASKDNDDDGINDIYGIVIKEDLTDNLAAANGIQVLSVDEDGELILEINNPGFREILGFIKEVYSGGYKGGMSRQGFVDARACFYNDDASSYKELSLSMDDEIGFICYPSDAGLVRSASSDVQVAVLNKNMEVDESFLKAFDILMRPRNDAEEYFSEIFDDDDVVSMCVEMSSDNYISPIYMFRELHDFYLDMLRDVKAGFSMTDVTSDIAG